ncbi:NUDIX domain-containing protein [Paenibacillus sp. JNUCC31]|uniref:NUDIX domain-containing protein n=1 Tax=Paenibacillus sp. JNUCC-31 TaxID=2777983 RepID=UPI0017862492|nr:NUDIX domain-containing protein [Paenibacillus sp. JNUCC-31]QOS77777.1 NUDIX domain-containing protein [Paenibacillus sp. JNUCC-31]
MDRYTHMGVYGLVTWEQKVLLVHKARGAYKGKWDLPGGRLEFGEKPEFALHREFEEETGLSNLQLVIRSAEANVLEWMHQGEPEELHHIGILYDVYLTSESRPYEIKREPDGEDSLGAQWFTMEEVGALSLTPFAQYMINNSDVTGSAGNSIE